MLNDRYEEYVSFSDDIPFIYNADIERNDKIFSKEANWHENLELQFCTDGGGTVTVDGERIPFSEGECVAVNSNTIHHTGTDGSIVYSCIIFDTEFARSSGINVLEVEFERHFKDAEIAGLMSELRAVYEAKDDTCRTAKARMLTLEILIRLMERHCVGIREENAEASAHRCVKEAIKYVRRHYNERITLDVLAKSVFMNKFVLERHFKAVTHSTVIEYINRYRCDKARGMLSVGCGVGEAARACGFSNMSFFTKTFRNYVGVTPSEYKKLR